MDMFTYVFDEQARDALVEKGFTLIKSDDRNHIYVFLNKPEMSFALRGIKSVNSDTLSF